MKIWSSYVMLSLWFSVTMKERPKIASRKNSFSGLCGEDSWENFLRLIGALFDVLILLLCDLKATQTPSNKCFTQFLVNKILGKMYRIYNAKMWKYVVPVRTSLLTFGLCPLRALFKITIPESLQKKFNIACCMFGIALLKSFNTQAGRVVFKHAPRSSFYSYGDFISMKLELGRYVWLTSLGFSGTF